MGSLLLAGGAEFGGRMAEVDQLALERAGGPAARLRVSGAITTRWDSFQGPISSGVNRLDDIGAPWVAVGRG